MINTQKTEYKKAFTMVELMLLLVVFSLILASSYSVITKRHKLKPAKTLHGEYLCYYDATANNNTGGNREIYYQGNTLIRQGLTGNKGKDDCLFTLPTNATYFLVRMVGGGGAGGNANYAPVEGQTIKHNWKEFTVNLIRGYIDKNGNPISGGPVMAFQPIKESGDYWTNVQKQDHVHTGVTKQYVDRMFTINGQRILANDETKTAQKFKDIVDGLFNFDISAYDYAGSGQSGVRISNIRGLEDEDCIYREYASDMVGCYNKYLIDQGYRDKENPNHIQRVSRTCSPVSATDIQSLTDTEQRNELEKYCPEFFTYYWIPSQNQQQFSICDSQKGGRGAMFKTMSTNGFQYNLVPIVAVPTRVENGKRVFHREDYYQKPVFDFGYDLSPGMDPDGAVAGTLNAGCSENCITINGSSYYKDPKYSYIPGFKEDLYPSLKPLVNRLLKPDMNQRAYNDQGKSVSLSEFKASTGLYPTFNSSNQIGLRLYFWDIYYGTEHAAALQEGTTLGGFDNNAHSGYLQEISLQDEKVINNLGDKLNSFKNFCNNNKDEYPCNLAGQDGRNMTDGELRSIWLDNGHVKKDTDNKVVCPNVSGTRAQDGQTSVANEYFNTAPIDGPASLCIANLMFYTSKTKNTSLRALLKLPGIEEDGNLSFACSPLTDYDNIYHNQGFKGSPVAYNLKPDEFALKFRYAYEDKLMTYATPGEPGTYKEFYTRANTLKINDANGPIKITPGKGGTHYNLTDSYKNDMLKNFEKNYKNQRPGDDQHGKPTVIQFNEGTVDGEKVYKTYRAQSGKGGLGGYLENPDTHIYSADIAYNIKEDFIDDNKDNDIYPRFSFNAKGILVSDHNNSWYDRAVTILESILGKSDFYKNTAKGSQSMFSTISSLLNFSTSDNNINIADFGKGGDAGYGWDNCWFGVSNLLLYTPMDTLNLAEVSKRDGSGTYTDWVYLDDTYFTQIKQVRDDNSDKPITKKCKTTENNNWWGNIPGKDGGGGAVLITW